MQLWRTNTVPVTPTRRMPTPLQTNMFNGWQQTLSASFGFLQIQTVLDEKRLKGDSLFLHQPLSFSASSTTLCIFCMLTLDTSRAQNLSVVDHSFRILMMRNFVGSEMEFQI